MWGQEDALLGKTLTRIPHPPRCCDALFARIEHLAQFGRPSSTLPSLSTPRNLPPFPPPPPRCAMRYWPGPSTWLSWATGRKRPRRLQRRRPRRRGSGTRWISCSAKSGEIWEGKEL